MSDLAAGEEMIRRRLRDVAEQRRLLAAQEALLADILAEVEAARCRTEDEG